MHAQISSFMNQSCFYNFYIQALNIFLLVLNTTVHHQLLHQGLRQYFHRMVICLEDEVLPFVPIIIQSLGPNQNTGLLLEFIPLLNQIVMKFKASIAPFLSEVFMTIVRSVLAHANDDTLSDLPSIKRAYFQFIHAIASNKITTVIFNQKSGDLETVLTTLIEGASDAMDVTSQKTCFQILNILIQNWPKDCGVQLWNFITMHIIPSCFLAPLNPKFDLKDAQTVLALNESTYLMKTVFTKEGLKLDSFLKEQYLASLNMSPDLIKEYCEALAHMDIRNFRTYIKSFFIRAKT